VVTVGAGFVRGVRAVADADPGYIETALLELGGSRRYLAPVAWAAGTLVLVVRGAGLLVSNWRLALVELVPAAWVWLVMWDLKRRGLRAPPLREVTFGGVLLVLCVVIGASIVVFWLNVVFAFAITHERPRVRLAMGQARPFWGAVVRAGAGVGAVLTAGLAVIPRIDSVWLYVAAVLGVYRLMLVALVVVPARILGIGKRRLPPRQAVGGWAAGGALSVVAMSRRGLAGSPAPSTARVRVVDDRNGHVCRRPVVGEGDQAEYETRAGRCPPARSRQTSRRRPDTSRRARPWVWMRVASDDQSP
jgi:hypothetical protein